MSAGADPDASLCEAAAAIASGSVTSRELTERCIERAESEQQELNCFISLDADAALAAAERADRAAGEGRSLGPLHGVPLAHKDLFYREGRICTCGSRVRRDFVPDRTATVLSRLDAAGAIDLGTLNLSEFAAGPSGHNEHFGDCRNPWNTRHIAGGSSSGSAAACAARIVYGALGSDTAGSVRLPAAACGVVGLMPTRGRVSGWGVMPFSWSLDTPGPLARTARDCARLLSVIAGADALDPRTLPDPAPDFEQGIDDGIDGLRIAVPAGYFRDGVSAELERALDESVAVMCRLGATVVDVEVPGIVDNLAALSHLVQKPEASAIHAQWLRERPEEYSDRVRIRMDEGFHVSAVDYIDALRLRAAALDEFAGAMFADADVVHVPVLPDEPPTFEATEASDPRAVEQLLLSLTHATRPFNYLGLPAIAVPCGFSARGLPLSFQLAGPPCSESLLLRAAHAYEGATEWTRRRPDGARRPAPAD